MPLLEVVLVVTSSAKRDIIINQSPSLLGAYAGPRDYLMNGIGTLFMLTPSPARCWHVSSHFLKGISMFFTCPLTSSVPPGGIRLTDSWIHPRNDSMVEGRLFGWLPLSYSKRPAYSCLVLPLRNHRRTEQGRLSKTAPSSSSTSPRFP